MAHAAARSARKLGSGREYSIDKERHDPLAEAGAAGH
jgi:hypothetical protein